MKTSSVAADAGNDCCVCAEELINDNRTPCCRQRIHTDCFARAAWNGRQARARCAERASPAQSH